MSKSELFNKIVDELNGKLQFLEDKPEETPETTLRALWLASAGIHVSAVKAQDLLIPDLTDAQIEYLYKLIDLRLNKTPLAHITKRQNFMGIELICDNRALIPRKETELLGKKAVDICKIISISSRNVKAMDVCCGSGNLGIALAYFDPNCIVYSSDISFEAVELTKENINLLNLGERVYVQQGDMMSAFESQQYYKFFDLIICNPPYISSSKVTKMNSEIANNEPKLAFDGGMLGTKIIQNLIREAPKFLCEKGWLVFEVGAGQGKFIAQLCERTNSFSKIETVSDNSDLIRVITAQK